MKNLTRVFRRAALVLGAILSVETSAESIVLSSGDGMESPAPSIIAGGWEGWGTPCYPGDYIGVNSAGTIDYLGQQFTVTRTFEIPEGANLKDGSYRAEYKADDMIDIVINGTNIVSCPSVCFTTDEIGCRKSTRFKGSVLRIGTNTVSVTIKDDPRYGAWIMGNYNIYIDFPVEGTPTVTGTRTVTPPTNTPTETSTPTNTPTPTPTPLPPTASISSVDLCTDRFDFVIGPVDENGTLTVIVEGASDAYDIYRSFAIKGGSYFASLRLDDQGSKGEFSSVKLAWTTNGGTIDASTAVAFVNLGSYKHSQYTIPDESNETCSSGSKNVCITDSSCTFTSSALPRRFVSEVNENGTGLSVNHGYIQQEAFCVGERKTVPKGCERFGNVFRGNVSAPEGAWGPLGSSTVAVRADHPELGPSDSICIVGLGRKTVTDRCNGCTLQQLDNYTDDGRCAGIEHLGNHTVIKLL